MIFHSRRRIHAHADHHAIAAWLSAALSLSVLLMLLTPAAGKAAPSVPETGSGACGTTLLAGSKWLHGLGVDIYSNGALQGQGTSCGGLNYVNGTQTGYEWQCVELIDRLYLTRGWISSYWSGNGGDSALGANDSMYDQAPSSLTKQPNTAISYVGPGDVVSVNEYINGVFQPDGHVFIVNTAGQVTSGKVSLVSQNFGTASAPIVKSSGKLSGGTLTIPALGTLTFQVIGVVHAPPASWQAIPAPLPANAQAAPNAVLTSVACPSATMCNAVGSYKDGPGQTQYAGFIVSGSGGSWTAVQAPLPDNASGTYSSLSAVACPSAKHCVAVGNYIDSTGIRQGLILTGSGTSWTATEAPVPEDNDNGAFLNAVACTSVSSCTAVGVYNSMYGPEPADLGLLVTGSSAVWTASEAPEPANALDAVTLSAVTCLASGSCVATGTYNDLSAAQQGLLTVGSGTSWTATEAPAPADAALDPAVSLTSPACSADGSCLVAGQYTDTAGYTAGLLVTGSASSWTSAKAPLPSNAEPGNATLNAAACPSATSCVAIGQYASASGSQGLLVAASGTGWTHTQAQLPPDAYANPEADLEAIACPSSQCAAAGSYYATASSAGGYRGLIMAGSTTNWAPIETTLPASAEMNSQLNLFSIACASKTACVAAGAYVIDGSFVPLLATGAPLA
jgi:hypothetical protein